MAASRSNTPQAGTVLNFENPQSQPYYHQDDFFDLDGSGAMEGSGASTPARGLTAGNGGVRSSTASLSSTMHNHSYATSMASYDGWGDNRVSETRWV